MTTDLNKTGEDIYRRSNVSFDRVNFNAAEGTFFLQDKDAKKDETTNKYPKLKLTENGQSLDAVFLRIRRILFYFAKKNGQYAGMSTSEHNHKNEMVALYKPDGKEYGIAADLRDKYTNLHTQQVVYAYLPNEDRTVRLIIKGASLGSGFKHPKDVLKFYDYLQSFEKNQSSTEFITHLVPIEEEGPQGTYYALRFVKGDKLEETSEVYRKTRKLIDEISENIFEIDKRLQSGFDRNIEQKEQVEIKSNYPEYPTDDIDPADIPF